jgi:hypothetical protein
MAVNKVDFGGETLIDLSNDTVSVDNLLKGIIAHAANGEEIVGQLDITGYVKPSGTKTITSNGTHDVKNYASAKVNVPVPTEYVNKSLLQNAIHYFDLSSNKTGNSTVSSSWYSFTPAFKPKVILFSQAEYNNGNITKISNSINTVIGSLWVDPDILSYTRYYMKGWFLTTSTTPSINMSSNGTGAQYDEATNKIFMYSKGSSAYGLKAGTNSHSAISGYYMIQYWG